MAELNPHEMSDDFFPKFRPHYNAPYYDKYEHSLNHELYTKNELCKNWLRGCCKKTHCSWAHGNEARDFVLYFSTPYKTKMCKEFSKSKVCTNGPNGAACWFWHDEPRKHKCELEALCGGTCYGNIGHYCPFRHRYKHCWY